MWKKTVFIFFIFSFNTLLYSNGLKVTKERLVNRFWSTTEILNESEIRAWGGVHLQFNNNKTFSAYMSKGQDRGVRIFGKYEIKGGFLNLYYKNKIWLAKGVIKYDPKDLKYPYYLVFQNDLFKAMDEILNTGLKMVKWNKIKDMQTVAKEGFKIKLYEDEALSSGYKKAVTLDVLNLRSRPSITSPRIQFETVNGKKVYSLKKGFEIRVLARSIDKDVVEGWNNYWYYIEINNFPVSIIYAWVYGEFIKFLDQ
ncbi:MAG: hypothetical protein JXB50_06325 [Spirochaetes bacterium]|nr:hypothetical protein [Spirochaetota bacterium]